MKPPSGKSKEGSMIPIYSCTRTILIHFIKTSLKFDPSVNLI